MNLPTQPYKGSRDFYPEDKRIQKYMFGVLREVVESYGYQEYDAPILEPFEIYAAKTGEEIVSEQLYSFEDKGGRKVAIRPEMTPSVSRMVAGRRQELAYPLRWYSIPNLWRYERPQRGRLREHWQLNVDLFGVEGLEGDMEIIQVADSILTSFGAQRSDYQIRVNSRARMQNLFDELSLSDDERKLVTGLIDKKSKIDAAEFEQMFRDKLDENKAAQLLAYLNDSTEPDGIAELVRGLKDIGVENVSYDRSIVRGLDYYTDIVFEVYDTDPENNRSMFGGGRYDGLVGLFGVEPVPTVGFGMGDVTLQNFLVSHGLLKSKELALETDAAVILIGDVYGDAQKPLGELRVQGARLAVDSSGRKLDAQIKNAVKSGVKYAIFIGEKELADNIYKLRDLEKGEEKALSLEQIASTLNVRRTE